MKNYFLLSIVLCVLKSHSFCQEKISYISKNRDTLFLPNNNTGQLIFASWNNVPNNKRPVIIFIEEDLISQMHAKKEDE